MEVRNLEAACKTAYEHGRKDYLAGVECDPNIPLNVYETRDAGQRNRIMESWMNG